MPLCRLLEPFRLAFTGNPFPWHVRDLWQQLRAMGPTEIGKQRAPLAKALCVCFTASLFSSRPPRRIPSSISACKSEAATLKSKWAQLRDLPTTEVRWAVGAVAQPASLP